VRSITMTGSLLKIIGGRLNEVIKSLHLVGFVFLSKSWCRPSIYDFGLFFKVHVCIGHAERGGGRLSLYIYPC